MGTPIAGTSPGGEIRHSGERLSDLAAEGGSGCHYCAVLDKVNSVLDRVWPQWTRWWWVAVLVIAGVTALGVREPWLLPLVVPLYVLIVLVWGRAIVRGFGRSLMSGGVSADRSSYDLVECVLVYGLRRVFRFGAARRETGRRAGHRGSMGPADVPMLVT